jgi:rfaE bifunctional protein kinase chain/domain
MTDKRRLLDIVNALDQATVVLYGDLVLDRFILGTPKRISREAPVIILRHEGERDVPGGGANALANLAALGVRAVPVAAVGDDESGRSLLRELQQRGIDTSCIVSVQGFRTPTKVRILGGGQSSLKHQVARYDIEDHLPERGPWRDQLADAFTQRAAEAGAVAISDYGYGTVEPDLVKRLTQNGAPPPWVCGDSRHRVGRFESIHAATPNLQELELSVGRTLTSDDQVAEAAEVLRRRLGAGFVLATRGNRGMTLVAEHQPPHHIPVFGTDQVADVTWRSVPRRSKQPNWLTTVAPSSS